MHILKSPPRVLPACLPLPWPKADCPAKSMARLSRRKGPESDERKKKAFYGTLCFEEQLNPGPALRVWAKKWTL